jgi:hypothetical protein
MVQPNDESTLIPVIREWILDVEHGTERLENLISAARLDQSLLLRPALTQTVFRLDPKRITIVESPPPDRLTLVYPESFFFEWKLRIKGYFLVKHKFIDQSLPHPVESFTIRYTGIVVPVENFFQFKNERVELG